VRLTPIEIKKQQFKKVIRGYDSVEVDTFLELVAGQYENLLVENESDKKQLIAMEAELKHFKEVERTLKQTLYNVQESSQLSKENSQKEANLIIREAELTAAQLTERAKLDVQKMMEEVAQLKQQKKSISARLRHLLSSQLELLEVLDLDDEDIIDLKDRTKKVFSGRATEKTSANIASSPKDEQKQTSGKGAAGSKSASEQDAEEKTSKPPAVKPSEKQQGRDFFKDIFSDDINDANNSKGAR